MTPTTPRTTPTRARELVVFARRHGYRVDELVEIIKDVT